MSGKIVIRAERPEDRESIFQVNTQAFPTSMEAELVDALREVADPWISLVAVAEDRVVGHILFTPVALRMGEGPPRSAAPRMAGLAPMAVLPDHQRIGIGSRLVRSGLEACRAAGFQAVVVLGHETYYPSFGFAPASRWDLHFPGAEGHPAFMALDLEPGALAGARGHVDFLPPFGAL